MRVIYRLYPVCGWSRDQWAARGRHGLEKEGQENPGAQGHLAHRHPNSMKSHIIGNTVDNPEIQTNMTYTTEHA